MLSFLRFDDASKEAQFRASKYLGETRLTAAVASCIWFVGFLVATLTNFSFKVWTETMYVMLFSVIIFALMAIGDVLLYLKSRGLRALVASPALVSPPMLSVDQNPELNRFLIAQEIQGVIYIVGCFLLAVMEWRNTNCGGADRYFGTVSTVEVSAMCFNSINAAYAVGFLFVLLFECPSFFVALPLLIFFFCVSIAFTIPPISISTGGLYRIVLQNAYNTMFHLWCGIVLYWTEKRRRQTFLDDEARRDALHALTFEKQLLTEFILRIVPKEVCDRLLREKGNAPSKSIIEVHETITAVAVEIVDYTSYFYQQLPQQAATQIVTWQQHVGDCARSFNLFHVGTMGDLSLIVANALSECTDPEVHIFRFCYRLQGLCKDRVKDLPTKLRMGVHCGQGLSAFVGQTGLHVDCFGPAVEGAVTICHHCTDAALFLASKDVLVRVCGSSGNSTTAFKTSFALGSPSTVTLQLTAMPFEMDQPITEDGQVAHTDHESATTNVLSGALFQFALLSSTPQERGEVSEDQPTPRVPDATFAYDTQSRLLSFLSSSYSVLTVDDGEFPLDRGKYGEVPGRLLPCQPQCVQSTALYASITPYNEFSDPETEQLFGDYTLSAERRTSVCVFLTCFLGGCIALAAALQNRPDGEYVPTLLISIFTFTCLLAAVLSGVSLPFLQYAIVVHCLSNPLLVIGHALSWNPSIITIVGLSNMLLFFDVHLPLPSRFGSLNVVALLITNLVGGLYFLKGKFRKFYVVAQIFGTGIICFLMYRLEQRKRNAYRSAALCHEALQLLNQQQRRLRMFVRAAVPRPLQLSMIQAVARLAAVHTECLPPDAPRVMPTPMCEAVVLQISLSMKQRQNTTFTMDVSSLTAIVRAKCCIENALVAADKDLQLLSIVKAMGDQCTIAGPFVLSTMQLNRAILGAISVALYLREVFRVPPFKDLVMSAVIVSDAVVAVLNAQNCSVDVLGKGAYRARSLLNAMACPGLIVCSREVRATVEHIRDGEYDCEPPQEEAETPRNSAIRGNAQPHNIVERAEMTLNSVFAAGATGASLGLVSSLCREDIKLNTLDKFHSHRAPQDDAQLSLPPFTFLSPKEICFGPPQRWVVRQLGSPEYLYIVAKEPLRFVR